MGWETEGVSRGMGQQRPTQYSEAIILQLKINTLKKNRKLYWIGRKVPSVIKLKIKGTFFISTKKFIEQCIHRFVQYLLPFFRLLHNSIFPKIFCIFEQGTV